LTDASPDKGHLRVAFVVSEDQKIAAFGSSCIGLSVGAAEGCDLLIFAFFMKFKYVNATQTRRVSDSSPSNSAFVRQIR
jgi:hypothetical protein